MRPNLYSARKIFSMTQIFDRLVLVTVLIIKIEEIIIIINIIVIIIDDNKNNNFLLPKKLFSIAFSKIPLINGFFSQL